MPCLNIGSKNRKQYCKELGIEQGVDRVFRSLKLILVYCYFTKNPAIRAGF